MILELAIAATNHMTEGDFNEVHPNIKLREGDYFVTAFQNSEYNTSFGVGYTFRSGDLFLDTAIVTGYEYADVLPMIRGGLDTGNTRWWVAPSVTPEGDVFGIVGFEIYVTFGE